MCGYLFLFSKNKTKINKEKFLKSSKYIEHRGPDDFSTFFNEDVAMSFYRLSIRDLSSKAGNPC